MTVSGGATISVRSLSPFGERVGVRGSQNYREALTPHPTPLPMGEGADRACRRLVIECHDSSHGESALNSAQAAEEAVLQQDEEAEDGAP